MQQPGSEIVWPGPRALALLLLLGLPVIPLAAQDAAGPTCPASDIGSLDAAAACTRDATELSTEAAGGESESAGDGAIAEPTAEPETTEDAPVAAAAQPASLSIGSPGAGLLLHPTAMPDGPYWVVKDPQESYGTAETIDYIRGALRSVAERFPGTPRVVIGDISRADGGRLKRHASHQCGRDADIGLYYRQGEVNTFLPADARTLDVARTWALVRAFVTDSDVERIFLDRSLQRLLLAHARAIGEDEAWLTGLFNGRPLPRALPITSEAALGDPEFLLALPLIQHEPRHRDHMHVRFYNPRAQDEGRQAYPRLVASGQAPPPAVRHLVRPGETLGSLARRYGVKMQAIRTANGLGNSFLRAGRSYLIPLRTLPTTQAAVVIPPRRLPPTPAPAGVEAAASTSAGASSAGH